MTFEKGTLTEIFRRRRRGLVPEDQASLPFRHIHPPSGAKLFFAKLKKPPRNQGPYVVGWLPQGEAVTSYYKNFSEHSEALAFFYQARDGTPPVINDFQRDPQMNNVYGWESDFRLKSRPLTKRSMERISARLADIFNMEAPGIEYRPNKKKRTYAEADLKRNVIQMYRPNLAILLHEFAHLVNDQVNKDNWAWHGPGFMRTYLAILSLFPKVGQHRNLEETAQAQGLSIADENDIPAIRCLKKWRSRQADEPSTIPGPT